MQWMVGRDKTKSRHSIYILWLTAKYNEMGNVGRNKRTRKFKGTDSPLKILKWEKIPKMHLVTRSHSRW